jgi:polyisoprenoid-binding protein YceI
MKRKQFIVVIAAAVVVIGVGSYAVFNNYLGNNVEVESVLAQSEGAVLSEGASTAANTTPNTTANTGSSATGSVSTEKLNGKWDIAKGSKVYLSVTTSKETVNFVNEAVTGSWTVDLANASSMKGEGVVDMNGLDSGNSQRDGHVKERADLLEVSKYPQATFTTKSFSQVPAEWTEGTTVPLTVEGTLTVKGKEKDVTFETKAMYKGGQLLISGKTKVTFTDFGMKSPHNIVLEAENELSVQLELVLNKA